MARVLGMHHHTVETHREGKADVGLEVADLVDRGQVGTEVVRQCIRLLQRRGARQGPNLIGALFEAARELLARETR